MWFLEKNRLGEEDHWRALLSDPEARTKCLEPGLDCEVRVGLKGKERERDNIIPKEGGGWEN